LFDFCFDSPVNYQKLLVQESDGLLQHSNAKNINAKNIKMFLWNFMQIQYFRSVLEYIVKLNIIFLVSTGTKRVGK